MIKLLLLLSTVALDANISPRLLFSICAVESGLDPSVVNLNDGNGRTSLGLCQIQLRTARDMGYTGTKEGLLNARINATYAAKYIKFQLKRYNGNVNHAIAAYNAGSVRKRNGKYVNARYVAKVKEFYNAFGD